MALDTSRSYKALIKSNNLMWGGDKFLMKILLGVSFFLILGVRGWFGYGFGAALLIFGRWGLVWLAKKDPDALPVYAQSLFFKRYFLSRSLYPGPYSNIIFTFDPKKFKVVSGIPWYWRVYYWIFPATDKRPTKIKNLFTKKESTDV
ncbi:MAG: hypothetical protein EKK54_06150 [Neisseriaceae bacterium]|nr:MAG: hypothetical protein EKK54_06150 [Neisseriaceae bacterium]